MQQLATAADQWVTITFPKGVLKFSARHKEIVTELVFLRAFLAWEAFLEESFILYLLGKKSPKGKSPSRLYTPSARKDAIRLIFGDQDYTDWTTISKLTKRADRYFQNGEPYSRVLKSQQNFFDQMKIIRNAVAHTSGVSKEKFKNFIRQKLTFYPSKLTVGGFLAMTIPGSSPPESFLESYLTKILFAAQRIVPK
ncbi:hypothetical protein L0244_34505 [bacterium]|nr:hypothetical protein [bacterium]